MKGNKKIALLYVVISIMVSCGAVVFQHILNNNYLDRNGLYTSGALTPEIFVVYAVLSSLLILTVIFLLRFDIMPKEMKNGSVNTSVVSVIVAVVMVYAAIMFFTGNTQTVYAPGSSELMVYRLKLISSVMAFPAALYFMVITFMGKRNSSAASYLSFFPLLWTLFFVMSMYFDRTVLINSPLKSIQQFALVLLMLYQLYEIRAYIGKSRMLANFLLSLLSTLFLSAAFFPVVIDIAMGRIRIGLDNIHCITGALFALYTLSRAIDFAFNSEINIAQIIADRAKEEQDKLEKIKEAEAEEAKKASENDGGDNKEEIDSLLESLNAAAEETEENGEVVSLEALLDEAAETTDAEEEGVEAETAEEGVEEAVEENNDGADEEPAKTSGEKTLKQLKEELFGDMIEKNNKL